MLKSYLTQNYKFNKNYQYKCNILCPNNNGHRPHTKIEKYYLILKGMLPI